MPNLLLLILSLALTLFPAHTTHTVTYYWPSEDGWGTAVADPVLMRHGPLPQESWDWPLCAVSPDLLGEYPYGTWLWVEGEGLKRVSDRTAGWVKDTVDVRVAGYRMERYQRKVWRVL